MTIKLLTWGGTFTACLSSLLFLIRAHAVFHDSKKAKIALNVLWFLASLGTFTAPFSFRESRLGNTNFCALAAVDKLGSAGTVTVAIFDTAIFVSTYFRVMTLTMGNNVWERMQEFFKGSGTGQVSKALLQTGQPYYL